MSDPTCPHRAALKKIEGVTLGPDRPSAAGQVEVMLHHAQEALKTPCPADALRAKVEAVKAKFPDNRCPSCGFPEEPGDDFEGYVGMKARAEKAEAALAEAQKKIEKLEAQK